MTKMNTRVFAKKHLLQLCTPGIIYTQARWDPSLRSGWQDLFSRGEESRGVSNVIL